MGSGSSVDASLPSVDASATREKDASTPSGDEDAGPVHGELAPMPVCDGSKDIRLVWQLDDELMRIVSPFPLPYGKSILVVDGQCRFHASRDPRAGYVTGTLSAGQASALSRELAFAELWRVGSRQYSGGGVDFPAVIITTPAGAVRCECACSPGTPQTIADALQGNAEHWLRSLLEQGKLLTPRAVSALALPLTDTSRVVEGGPKAWPLEKRMDDIPNLKLTSLSDPRWYRGRMHASKVRARSPRCVRCVSRTWKRTYMQQKARR